MSASPDSITNARRQARLGDFFPVELSAHYDNCAGAANSLSMAFASFVGDKSDVRDAEKVDSFGLADLTASVADIGDSERDTEGSDGNSSSASSFEDANDGDRDGHSAHAGVAAAASVGPFKPPRSSTASAAISAIGCNWTANLNTSDSSLGFLFGCGGIGDAVQSDASKRRSSSDQLPARFQHHQLQGGKIGLGQPRNEDRELFIGNLAAEVTNEDLVKIFSEFGAVKSVGIAKDASGACKGFGFLAFHRPELAETVLESPRLFILYDRVLRVDWRLRSGGNSRRNNLQPQQLSFLESPADPVSPQDEDEAHGSCSYAEMENRQLFVGNLASDVTQGDLRQYFRRWGELLYCYVIRDEDGQSKRYGFITFKDPRIAEQLMQSRSSHVLKGKRLRFEMPKRSREEAFSLRHTAPVSRPQELASPLDSPPPPVPADLLPPASPSLDTVACSKTFEMAPSPLPPGPPADGGPEASLDERLPLWLHTRLMAEKELLIASLRKELGLCSLLAERRVNELGQAKDRQVQMLRSLARQLEARVRLQTAEIETLREQLDCRSEQVKLLTAKVETLLVEVFKAWGCAAASKTSPATATAAAAATAASGAQEDLYHLQYAHRTRPDSGIGM